MSGSTQSKETSILRCLVLKCGPKRVLVKRQKSYNLMFNSACKTFPSISRDILTFQTNQLDVCDGHYVEITAEVWSDIVDLLHVVEVTQRVKMTLPVPLPLDNRAISLPDNQSAPGQVNEQDSSRNDDEVWDIVPILSGQGPESDGQVTIKLVFRSGEIKTITVSREMQVDKLVADASEILGCHLALIDAIFGGVRMHANRTIGSYNIEDGDSINIRVNDFTRIRKPVIYLYSPSDIDVSVKLSLIPEWKLSVIYPIVTTEDHGRRLEWNVHTHQDGSLTERDSGLNVSYLFWEAETNSQAASKPQPVDTFNPASSSLDDTDSIVIPVDKVTVYLDNSLKVLGLHPEARTSFITYWLPSILKHEYVALRFVPQAAFERAASLRISPQPDVVTRVFMLFKGIRKEDLANWTSAQNKAEKDVAWWVNVVGVDPARAGDVTLFRALEWGGMEVLI
ncbi:uncharacterized protein F5891DRAFT_732066 [Suillus fuscotomentosus]|uniref:Ubiquitin-like domain-containing protein n=1 Tax=Suillus fuscotomentosus TaxID=1912939 RepID=A0AAD4DUL8_9AGAM|nr:uncharacterized protein F5891DRAFT_732066 [Suillus fuscotomentosus]KAG1894233.1 hypothetical protein F5891DRAFT_732066 [Suillus fuscotomentosus]